MTFRADLHCHTTCSDGSKSPQEIIELAALTLQGLSITDHDSIKAYDSVLPLAKSAGLLLISGIEFSSMHLGTSIHVLGYAFDLQSEFIHNLCQRHVQRRKERNLGILELLTKKNVPISEDDLIAANPLLKDKEQHTIGRPHIAKAMMMKGYVETIQEAFQRYLAENACCYVSGTPISTQETIDTIHEANGFAVIAHPHLIGNARAVKQLLEMNFDGIESYYAKLSFNQERKWIDIACKKGWLITGGSDFHGDFKPQIPLGCSWTTEETFRKLYERFQSNNQQFPLENFV